MDSKNVNQIEYKNEYENNIHLQNNVKIKDSKIKTIESQLSLEKTKVQNLEAKLLNKDNELRNTKNRLISLEDNFVNVKRELNFTKKELSSLTSSFDNKINVLEEDFADVKQELIETKKQLSQVTNQVSQVTKQVSQVNNQVSQVNNQVSQVSGQLSNVNKQLAEETKNSHYFKQYLLNRSLENEYIRNNDKITKKIISPLSYLYLITKSKFSEIGINIKLYRALKGSNSFDIGYYFNKYPDIPKSKWCKYFTPQLHYVCKGFAEKRTFSDKNYSYNNKSELLKEIEKN